MENEVFRWRKYNQRRNACGNKLLISLIMQNISNANDKLQEVFQNIDLIEGDNHEEDVP